MGMGSALGRMPIYAACVCRCSDTCLFSIACCTCAIHPALDPVLVLPPLPPAFIAWPRVSSEACTGQHAHTWGSTQCLSLSAPPRVCPGRCSGRACSRFCRACATQRWAHATASPSAWWATWRRSSRRCSRAPRSSAGGTSRLRCYESRWDITAEVRESGWDVLAGVLRESCTRTGTGCLSLFNACIHTCINLFVILRWSSLETTGVNKAHFPTHM